MTSSTSPQKKNRYSVRVLDRAFSLLDILADGRPRNLVTVSAESQLDTSTTFRLLAALQEHRYVARSPQTGEYSLGIRCMELARAYLSVSVVSVALPHMVALRDDTRETVHLAVLDQMEVVYVDKQEGLHAIGIMSSRIGGRNPAYCTGVGKALLAYQNPTAVQSHFAGVTFERFTDTTVVTAADLMAELSAVRRRGFALDLGEHEAEVRCVAAPVFDAGGNAVAAISVSGPQSRLNPVEQQTGIIQKVLATADRISTLLGAPASTRPPLDVR